jgi:DNA-binding LacI/PurR family transcriptional regulator
MSEKAEKVTPVRARRAATLADVGREAGVSAMAASAVLNGPSTSTRISKETQERVLAAAKKLRYRPNQTARGLVDRRMNTIGLVGILAGDEPNLYFLEVFDGLVQEATALGQNVTVFNVGSWEQGYHQIPKYCDGRVDGLILLAPIISAPASEWLPEHTPAVAVHPNYPLPGAPNFRADDEGGAFMAVKHLLKLGHRRILHIGGPLGAEGARLRVDGYRRAHQEAGIDLQPDYIVRTEFTAEGGRSALDGWLAEHRGQPLPDAIFAASDAIALGCLDRLQASGLRVPQDISIIGFDNTLFARAAHLSTIAQPLSKLGRLAVRALLRLIEAQHAGRPVDDADTAEVLMETELVERATLAAPRETPLLIS